MRCQRAILPNSSILDRASWTRFSPRSVTPASTASRILAGSTVLETATRRTSEGSLPTDWAARAILSFTLSRFSLIPISILGYPFSHLV